MFRKVVSDISHEIEKYEALEGAIDEVKQVECECCGLNEDCTADYIAKVKVSHSGKWVCGLCSEAVKEKLVRGKSPDNNKSMAMKEAVSSHRDFCQMFNNTTRLNPKLSLTSAMREIAKRSCNKRRDLGSPSASKIARSISCVPRINEYHISNNNHGGGGLIK